MRQRYNFEVRAYINGQSFYITKYITIYDLLQYLGYKPKNAILEWNKKLISLKEAKNMIIKSGDTIEFVGVVGGG